MREKAKLPGGDGPEIFQVASDGRNVNSFTATNITTNYASNRGAYDVAALQTSA